MIVAIQNDKKIDYSQTDIKMDCKQTNRKTDGHIRRTVKLLDFGALRQTDSKTDRQASSQTSFFLIKVLSYTRNTKLATYSGNHLDTIKRFVYIKDEH